MALRRPPRLDVNQLEIVAPDKRKHGERVYDLLAKAFSEMGYYRTRDLFRDYYLNHSHYDWSVARIGLIGERVVTHYGVWGYDMRIGTARVRCGGVGGVATDGDLRKLGLMDRTARASLAAMREVGYDLSILFGIPDFYHRFGYVRAWPEVSFTASVSDLPSEPPPGRLKPFRPRPLPELLELYNRRYATLTGTAVRPTYTKAPNPWHPLEMGYCWSGKGGGMTGYLLLSRRGARLNCVEYCGEAEEALRALGALARRWHCQEVHFETVPYLSDLARLLRRGTCRVEARYERCGSAMVCLLNLRTTLERMAGELSRRLRESALAGWQGELLIASGQEEVALRIAAGRVAVASPTRTPHRLAGGKEIVQLLIGTDDPSETVAAHGMRLSGDARLLVEALFPAQWPQLCAFDRY